MIALEIDRDPFLIFKLQGLDLLDALNFEIDKESIKDISDLFNGIDNPTEGIVDFSRIDDIHEQIFSLLDENPVFYQKDFKSILDNIYKSMPRYLKKHDESYTRQHFKNLYNSRTRIDFEYEPFKGNEDEYDGWLENIFLERWGMPNQWETFNLNVNNNYEISKITTYGNTPLNKDKSERTFFNFFVELSESPIEKFNENIRFLSIIHQFTFELIKNHAIV